MPSAIAQDYGKLLSEVLPQVIETGAQYETIAGRLSDLVRRGRSRTSGETRLMKLLALLVHDYDQRHALPPAGMPPHEALGYLMEKSGKTSSDLLNIFGQRSHVHEALHGKRKISADQARELAGEFKVSPAVFI